MRYSSLLLLLATHAAASRSGNSQAPLRSPSQQGDNGVPHEVDPAILAALKQHADPVDALVSLHPEMATKMAEKRLLRIAGDAEPRWMTEGDKMRLRRKRTKFTDVTDFQDFHVQAASETAKPHLPKLEHGRFIKPLFSQISTANMEVKLRKLSSFYTRSSHTETGERSAAWIYGQVADIIKQAPFHTKISLNYFPHTFVQPTVIARFEPKTADASLPLTIVGAHQDSMNYDFPLLPAPGADDDGSGSITIMEAFRVLALSGYIPKNGPVEFHWFAAEEDGLLGSQAVAKFKKETNATIGAMMEFDMTAFVGRNATEEIGLIKTSANPDLTDWTLKLAKEYSSIPSFIHTFPEGAGSDYMSFTMAGFPSCFATEGNPGDASNSQDGMGDMDPYVHTSGDVIDIDNKDGTFSFDHMARFAELAIAFVVEQAGWNNKWRDI